MPKILIKYLDTWTDISSWLVSSPDVPILFRNRDWSPVFNGIRISISNKVPSVVFSNGLEILIQWDSDDHYLGYIKHFVFNYDSYTWDIEINHFLMKLEDYRLRKSELQADLISGVIDFTGGANFTVNASTHICTSAGHSLTNSDRVAVVSDGTLPDPLEENHLYTVSVIDADTFYLFKDWGNYITTYWADFTRKINFTDTGTGNHSFTKITDQTSYHDWGFYRDIKITGVDATNDQIICAEPYNSIPAEGNYHGSFGYPFFTLVLFHGSDLPAPLAEDEVYIAAKFENDAGFVLYDSLANYNSNSRINITDSGSGEMWFSIPLRFGIYTQEEDDFHNVTYPTPFVQLKYLIVKMFEKIGVTLETTDIDDIVYHRFNTTEWTWSEVYLLENMLYNLNQQGPLNPDLVDTRALDAQITFLQFIQNMFGKLGITLKYTGDYTYKLTPQKRDASYFITPDNEDYYVIPDDNKTGYNVDTFEASGGWIHSRFLAPPDAWCFRYADQDKRTDTGTGAELDSKGYSGDTYEYYASRIGGRLGAGINDIEWTNHLFLFLKRKHYAGNNFVEDDPQLRFELYDFSNTGDVYSILQNELNAVTKDFLTEEIECRANQLSQGKWSVKELYLDIAKRRIKIVQEKTTN